MRPRQVIRPLSPAAMAAVWYSQSTEQRLALCIDGMAFHAAKKNVPSYLFWCHLFDMTVLEARHPLREGAA